MQIVFVSFIFSRISLAEVPLIPREGWFFKLKLKHNGIFVLSAFADRIENGITSNERIRSIYRKLIVIWYKVFKSGPSKIFGRQPLKI